MEEMIRKQAKELKHEIWELGDLIEYKQDKGLPVYDLIIKYEDKKEQLKGLENLLPTTPVQNTL